MDIRQLSYFLEVANHASFSKASQNMNLSQPTLSKMVKNLEDELGVVLFDRSTRRMKLTDAGEVVQVHAQMIMKMIEDLGSALADLTQTNKGTIKLGLPPVIGASFFPETISMFHHRFPLISIQLVEEGGKLIEQSLLEDKLDLGAVVLPVDETLFEAVPLVKRHLLLAVNPKHPLANKSELALTDLAGEPFILFRRGFALHDRVREACIREGFEPNIVFESSQWDFISEMVAADLGISLLPETICNKFDPGKIAVIRTLKPVIHWDLALIWRRNKYLSHAMRRWIQFVRDVFQSGF